MHVESSLASELHREVVFERELNLQSVAVKTVRVVLPAAPLELAADHDVGSRVVEDVAERVLPGLERIRRLGVGVVVVLPRIAERAGELVVPLVIDERYDA